MLFSIRLCDDVYDFSVTFENSDVLIQSCKHIIETSMNEIEDEIIEVDFTDARKKLEDLN